VKKVVSVLIILAFSALIYAEGVKFSGILNTGYGRSNTKIVDVGTENQHIISTNMQLNMDYSYEKINFQGTLFGYAYDMPSDDKAQIKNYYEPFDQLDIFFRSLYVSYEATNSLSIGVGILPFSDSTPTKYNNDYVQDGEGIYALNDNNLASIFGLYKTNSSQTIFGLGTIDDLLVPKGNYIDETLRQGGSYTTFLINTYKATDKITVTSELLYNRITYEKIKISDAYLGGIASIYDNSEVSGWSFYNVLGISIYKNNNVAAKEEIFKHTLKGKAEYGDYMMSKYPNNFAIEKGTYYGAAMLWGGRKDFSISKDDFFISAEWFHTFGDWSSGNQGNIYLCQDNQIFNIRNDSYYGVFGWIINANSLVRLSYTYLEFDESTVFGTLPKTVPTEDYIGYQAKEAHIIRAIYSYKF